MITKKKRNHDIIESKVDYGNLDNKLINKKPLDIDLLYKWYLLLKKCAESNASSKIRYDQYKYRLDLGPCYNPIADPPVGLSQPFSECEKEYGFKLPDKFYFNDLFEISGESSGSIFIQMKESGMLFFITDQEFESSAKRLSKKYKAVNKLIKEKSGHVVFDNLLSDLEQNKERDKHDTFSHHRTVVEMGRKEIVDAVNELSDECNKFVWNVHPKIRQGIFVSDDSNESDSCM
jgi:hypothetical protein